MTCSRDVDGVSFESPSINPDKGRGLTRKA